MSDTAKSSEHIATDEIVCPHCGYEHGDSFEYLNAGHDDGETECDGCGKRFRWFAEITVTYSTEKSNATQALPTTQH